MPGDTHVEPGLFPLSAIGHSRSLPPGPHPQQLALIGEPAPVRIPAAEWAAWLADESVRSRYWAKVHRTSSDSDCWFFFGAISSTGHASFRAASLPGRTRRGTVPGHLYGYQLAHGVIPRLGWGDDHPTICHTCDNHSCQQPRHLRLGTPAENRAEWLARRRDPTGPLADVRGPAGRSRAIAAAIRAGRALGESDERIARRITAAIAAGRPLSLW
ncbi:MULTISPECIES: HNH endonuclease [Streptomyces]|uniref:HNH endonuclease n=1 Tax=Streptomyces TaxID=1883 RepID=UPI0021B01CBF|nr:HNH endonuclease [Streptomyces sp. WAC00469]